MEGLQSVYLYDVFYRSSIHVESRRKTENSQIYNEISNLWHQKGQKSFC